MSHVSSIRPLVLYLTYGLSTFGGLRERLSWFKMPAQYQISHDGGTGKEAGVCWRMGGGVNHEGWGQVKPMGGVGCGRA